MDRLAEMDCTLGAANCIEIKFFAVVIKLSLKIKKKKEKEIKNQFRVAETL